LETKKIIFMGTPDYATIILDKIVKDPQYEVIALFTQEDKKVGRKQLLTPPHIKQYALDNNLDFPIYQPSKLREEQNVEIIKGLNPDFIIVAAYGQILPESILNIAPCINLHASLLPLYRGASPIQEALLNDDSFTGVASMLMDVGLDTGDILGLKYLKLDKDMCVEEAFAKLSQIAADLTIETLENFEQIIPKKQNDTNATHCGKISKDDGLVDFTSAYKLYNKYRAYHYWPGIFLENGLKIKTAKLRDKCSHNRVGEILEIKNDSILLGCEKGTLEIFEVQAPSKKQVNIIDYLNGNRLNKGDLLH